MIARIAAAAVAKLPAPARAALDKHSGYAASKAAGAAMDRIYARPEGVVRNLPGHSIGPLAPAEFERCRKEIATPVVEEWTARIPNGAAILAAYRAEVMKVRAEK